MKNLITLCTVLACAFVVFFLTASTRQETSGNESYAIVTHTQGSSRVYIYYGGSKREEVKFKTKLLKDDNEKNEVINVLQTVSSKGYELISSTIHNYESLGQKDIEYTYTFRKKD